MAAQWQRWLRYAKAKLDSTVRESERELDRREAELEARAEGKPWLSSSGDAPTFDEARARIADRARQSGTGPGSPAGPAGGAGAAAPGGSGASASRPGSPARASGPGSEPAPEGGGSSEEAFDVEAQRRAGAERLAAIRDELGLADDPDGPTGGPAPKA
ncbi:MAG TPA: hypothetical protein VEW93_05990 [Acidimicrobiales bacterium]|nr:hypothetical protein [Acidimicrobiales bacterium]